MNISIISFTQNGERLSHRIKEEIAEYNVRLYTKRTRWEDGEEGAYRPEAEQVETSLSVWAGEQFARHNALLFIGAAGIAVRAVAPHAVSKLTDSPVLVMDEGGEYVIPLLSGHVGGANAIALRIAQKLGAQAVLTTATDVNHRFAVDVFAGKNRLTICRKEGIAAVSSKILAGKRATVSIEGIGSTEDTEGEESAEGAESIECAAGAADVAELIRILPAELELIPYPPKERADILISTQEALFEKAVLPLKPKEYRIGFGCRKGKPQEEIEAFIQNRLDALGITCADVAAIASIDVKKEEAGILAWSERHRVPFLTFSAEALKVVPGRFGSSAFVASKVGVDNVCERAAAAAALADCAAGRLAGCGGVARPSGMQSAPYCLVTGRQAENGMTFAAAKVRWNWKELDWAAEDGEHVLSADALRNGGNHE